MKAWFSSRKAFKLVDLAVGELDVFPHRFLAILARIFGREIDLLLGRIDGVEALSVGVFKRADDLPFAGLEIERARVGAAEIAIQAQAVEAVREQDVGLAVAVVIDPRGGGEIVAGTRAGAGRSRP